MPELLAVLNRVLRWERVQPHTVSAVELLTMVRDELREPHSCLGAFWDTPDEM